MATHEEHIEEERLEAYAMNRLGEDEAATVEEHLLFCTTCQEKLEEVESYVRAMRVASQRIRKEERQAPERSGAWHRLRGWLSSPLPIFAGALAMVAVIVLMQQQLRQPAGSPVTVELRAERGSIAGTVTAGRPLTLRLDNRGVEQREWPVEIVNQEGGRVWSGKGTWSEDFIVSAVDRALEPGTYFVRLFREGKDPAREYQLVVVK